MSGFDYAQMERRIASLEANHGPSLRFGRVTEVDPGKGTARVQIRDGDGMVSMPLRVMQRRTLKDKVQCLPDLGEHVSCLFSGQGLEQGVVLGACYSELDTAPNQEPQTDHVVYEDGTVQQYDRKSHAFLLDVTPGGSILLRVGASQIKISSDRILIESPLVEINP